MAGKLWIFSFWWHKDFFSLHPTQRQIFLEASGEIFSFILRSCLIWSVLESLNWEKKTYERETTHLIDCRPAITRTVLFRMIPTEKGSLGRLTCLKHTSYFSFHLHRHPMLLKDLTPKTRDFWWNWICVKRALIGKMLDVRGDYLDQIRWIFGKLPNGPPPILLSENYVAFFSDARKFATKLIRIGRPPPPFPPKKLPKKPQRKFLDLKWPPPPFGSFPKIHRIWSR